MNITKEEYDPIYNLVKLEALLQSIEHQTSQARFLASKAGLSTDDQNSLLKINKEINYLWSVVQEKLPSFKKKAGI